MFTQNSVELQELFLNLYRAKTEDEVDNVMTLYPDTFNNPKNWYPLGSNESNFGVVENQQSSPIAALIEKVINSIDAILIRKSYETRIEPTSHNAPKSMKEAVQKFFPEWKNWDYRKFRRKQAESIQIIADGPKRNTSLIIYDDGEGQHPEDFEKTFLSLLRGNKNEIHFVQGKYNLWVAVELLSFVGEKVINLLPQRNIMAMAN